MASHRTIQGVLTSLAKAVAPILFDRAMAAPRFGDPVSPAVADLFARANIVASEVQERFARETIEVLKATSQLGDELTDLLGTVRVNEKTKALNQFQEILDLPLTAVIEAMVKTLTVLADTNQRVIAATKKRRKK